MPPMLQVMKDIGGVEMPEFLAKLSGESSTDGKPDLVAGEPRVNGMPVAPEAPRG